MRDCAKRVPDTLGHRRSIRRLRLTAWRWLLAAPLAMARFEVTEATTQLRNGVYELNAVFELSLPAAPRDALASGVPLYLTIDMQVLRERNWWWDETVAVLAQRYRLEFHALSGKYLAINLNTGVRRAFDTIDQTLSFVAWLRDFPLLIVCWSVRAGAMWGV